jgi:hypothetical protein
MDISYQRNNFQTFYAKMKIRLGGNGANGQPHNIAFEKGDSVQYDGSVLKYAGMEIPVGPALRSSIANGWFTLDEEDVNSGVDAVIPSRNVAKSQTKNTDLSRVQRRDEDDAMETDSHDEDTVMNVSDRRPGANADARHPGGRNIRAEPRVITAANTPRKGFKSKGLVINPDQIEEQEYHVVAQLRTPAKAKPVDMYSREAGKIKQDIENMEGSGAIPVRQRRREETIEREGVTMRHTAKMDRNAPIEVDVGQENDGQVVGKVRHTSKGTGNAEGVSVRDTSNIRAEKAAAANGKTVKAHSKDVEINTKMSPKLRMARRIDPNFPADWNFMGKLADRLAAAKEHGATPEFLEALYAAEGDQMRKMLEKTYPKQFRG